MKEFIFAVQFILCQETYYNQDGKFTNEIFGRASYNKDKVYLEADGLFESYKVTHIEKTADSHLVMFANKDAYGLLRATKNNLYVDFTVIEDSKVYWIKIKYKVKTTNFDEALEMY